MADPLQQPRRGKVVLGRYELGRLLGRGASAKVYHARDLRSGHGVAVKCICKQGVLKGGRTSHVLREVAAMSRLRRHPHVLRLLEVLASSSKIYFVMEFAQGGELFARIAGGRLSEDLARRYFQQLVSGVAFCHSHGIFHRDLKPENLLLDDRGNVKISDFGLCAVDTDGDGRLLHTLCGTPAFVAPEILAKKGYDGAKVDLWSCGVILFVLTAGYLPFNDYNLMAMYRKIYLGQYRCPPWTTPELRRLISRLLDPNPETRASVDGVLRDPWFRKGLDAAGWAAMTRSQYGRDEKDQEKDDRDLNAFDIISSSSGFDLSVLFEPPPYRERFASCEPAAEVLRRVEELAKREGVVSRRQGTTGTRLVVEGAGGQLAAAVEVRRLSDGLWMVETEKGRGEGSPAEEFWGSKLRPELERLAPVSCGHKPLR